MLYHRSLVIRTQRGVVLIISLIFLLVLTLMGVAAMQGTTMQERMAGNSQDRNVAFQAAEAALRDAEGYISNDAKIRSADFSDFDDNKGLYISTADPFALDSELSDTEKTREYDIGDSDIALSQNPHYLIERIDYICNDSNKFAIFRISARAQGVNSSTNVRLQSRYQYRYSKSLPCPPKI